MAAIASPTSDNMPWELLGPLQEDRDCLRTVLLVSHWHGTRASPLALDYVLSPHLLTDFRFGFFRYHVNVLPNDLGTTPAKDAGIPGINLGDVLTSGMPFVFVDGQEGDQFFFGHLCGCPLLENEQQFQWVSNWTKTVGNHVLKWGADFRYAQNLRVASDDSRTGSLAFFNSGTQGPSGGGLGLATFLLGDVSAFSRFASSIDDAGERQKTMVSSMARTLFGLLANLSSTMDCDGRFIFPSR